MSLFDIISTFLGIGAVAKDSISDSLDAQKKYKKAKSTESPTYYVNGVKEYHTKTGKEVFTSFSNEGHVLIKDIKTGAVLEDLTANKNNAREADMKFKGKSNGWAFYRICTWDGRGQSCNVWASDLYPGKYFFCWDNVPKITSILEEGNLRPMTGDRNRMEVTTFTGHKNKSYYMDGTEVTKEEIARRQRQKDREKAIQSGKAFYITKGENGNNIYRKVDTDELVTVRINPADKSAYFVLATQEVVEVEVHNKKRKNYFCKEIPGSPKWNEDGSEYID